METVGCEETPSGNRKDFPLRRRIGSAQAFHVSVGAHPRVRPGKETVISWILSVEQDNAAGRTHGFAPTFTWKKIYKRNVSSQPITHYALSIRWQKPLRHISHFRTLQSHLKSAKNRIGKPLSHLSQKSHYYINNNIFSQCSCFYILFFYYIIKCKNFCDVCDFCDLCDDRTDQPALRVPVPCGNTNLR